MPPKHPKLLKQAVSLSKMVDSGSEDEFVRSDAEMVLTPDSQSENRKPGAKRSTATKAKVTAAQNRVAKKPAAKAPPKGKARKALAEREEEEEEKEEPKPKRGRKGKEPVDDASPPKAKIRAAPARKRAPTVERDPEPEPEAMDVEERDLLRVEEESIVAPLPPPRPVLARARSASRQPDPLAQIRHRRQGSASDSERDPGLRRRLGDMTKKYEALEGKYKALREASVVEAQSNFEKLRKATEQKAKDQDEVIAALKRELAAQSKTNTEVKTLRAKLAAQEAENARLTAESKALSASLQDSRNEIRALTAKLSTARAASEPPAKMPGSAVKVRANQAVATAVAAKSEEVKLLKLKEDLYSDLTGLMIRGIQREADEDTYDCIQTGRNGTLRFYLTVSHQTSAVAGTPGPTSYEDAEFAYTPLFDAMNDQDLLDILPDYLTEEIAFPRSSAAKFYTKVVDCMSRKFEE